MSFENPRAPYGVQQGTRPEIQIRVDVHTASLGDDRHEVVLDINVEAKAEDSPVFLVELAYGWICWRLFGGRRSLLGAIVVLNLLDIPLMFPQPGTGAMLSAHPAILPALILVQIIASWAAVWWLSRPGETPRASL